MKTWKNVNGLIWWAQPGNTHRFVELFWDLATQQPIIRSLAGHGGTQDKTIPLPRHWILI